MSTLDPLKMIQQFRRRGGADFDSFVNKLIGAIRPKQGLLASTVSTLARTDSRDGEVDARGGKESSADRTGYFLSRSIWLLLKTADEADIIAVDMQKEINKPYARSPIEHGFSYCICICDLLTAEKKTELTNALRKAIQAIKPDAKEPDVFDVRDLAALANKYPEAVPLLLGWASQHFGVWVGEIPPGETANADAYCGNCGGPLGRKDYFGWYTCPRCKYACCGLCGGSLEPNSYGYGPGHCWYECPHCGNMDASGFLAG